MDDVAANTVRGSLMVSVWRTGLLIFGFLVWTNLAHADGIQYDGIIGSWNLYSDIDPMTDDKDVFAVDEAKSGQNNFGKPVDLIMGCTGEKVKILISWGEVVGIGDNQLEMRWGKPNKPETETYPSSPDGETTFLYDQNDDFQMDPDSVVKRKVWYNGLLMMTLIHVTEEAGGGLVVEITPDAENTIEVLFDLKGAKQVERIVEAACGWDAP